MERARSRLLFGLGHHMLPVPPLLWQPIVRASARKTGAGLGFMSEDHHRVRDHVVLELPGAAQAQLGFPSGAGGMSYILGAAADCTDTGGRGCGRAGPAPASWGSWRLPPRAPLRARRCPG